MVNTDAVISTRDAGQNLFVTDIFKIQLFYHSFMMHVLKQ